MLQVIRYIRGYLAIKVWGFSPERFMNLCSNHNILLWNIKYSSNCCYMNISLKDFYQLRGITRKTGTRAVITKRYGLPFLSVHAWKRKAFLIGLIGSLCFWIWMSGFIWAIEVEGNYYVSTDVFMDFLVQNDIHTGTDKSDVDIEKLEKAIRNEFNIITWTSAKIEGTRLLIMIKENEHLQHDREEDATGEGMDLVASKDGTIVRMITRRGVPVVQEGDIVKKGDVLVEGGVPIMNDDATINHIDFCKADADIYLQSVYTMKYSLKEKYVKKEYTGREKKIYFLMPGVRKLSVPEISKKYEHFDTLEEKKQCSLFKSFYLPISFGYDLKKEYILTEEIYRKEEVKASFEQRICKFVETLEEKGVQIIEKNVTIRKTSGIWSVNSDFLTVEKTGELKKTRLTQVEQPITEEIQE